MTRVKNASCSCCGGQGPLQWVPVVAKADPSVRTRIALCEQRCLQSDDSAWRWKWRKDLPTMTRAEAA